MIRLIDDRLLANLSAEARNSVRRRKNHNFHASDDAPANRLLNAVEPGSYIAPHRHLAPTKDETLVIVGGRLGLVVFDEKGNIAATRLIEAGGKTRGVDIPHGIWHSLVSLQPGSVFFEAKAGPYQPLTADEKAPWAPAEHDPGAEEYLLRLEALFAVDES